MPSFFSVGFGGKRTAAKGKRGAASKRKYKRSPACATGDERASSSDDEATSTTDDTCWVVCQGHEGRPFWWNTKTGEWVASYYQQSIPYHSIAYIVNNTTPGVTSSMTFHCYPPQHQLQPEPLLYAHPAMGHHQQQQYPNHRAALSATNPPPYFYGDFYYPHELQQHQQQQHPWVVSPFPSPVFVPVVPVAKPVTHKKSRGKKGGGEQGVEKGRESDGGDRERGAVESEDGACGAAQELSWQEADRKEGRKQAAKRLGGNDDEKDGAVVKAIACKPWAWETFYGEDRRNVVWIHSVTGQISHEYPHE